MKILSTCFLISLLSSQSFAFSQIHTNYEDEACFSPDEACGEKLVDFIQSAEKSIDIAIYSINLEDLVETLIKKSKTLKVRIVCDKVQAHGAKSKVHYLLEHGVDIRYGKQKGIMHDKFVIIDQKRIETGSFNYTNHAAKANQENQIYLASPSLVERFIERFEKIWETSVEINGLELRQNLRFHRRPINF